MQQTPRSIEHSFDWFQYTIAWPSDVKEWPVEPQEIAALVRTFSPNIHLSDKLYNRPLGQKTYSVGGYSRHYDAGYCTVHVDPMRREQKCSVQMTGDDLRAYRASGGTDDRLLQFYTDARGKMTRMDIAFDLRGFGINLRKVYQDWKRGEVKTRARSIRPMTSAFRDDTGEVHEATTLYFGSAQSNLMVRMYDKGAEQNTGEDWTRIELQLRDVRAAAAAADMMRHGLSKVGIQLLRNYIPQCPYLFWRELMKAKSIELSQIPRKDTEQDAWLYEVVLPLLARRVQQEWDDGESPRLVWELSRIAEQGRITRAEAYRIQRETLTRAALYEAGG